MAFSKINLEFSLVDRASAGVRKLSEQIKGVGGAGRAAAAVFDSSVKHIQGSLETLGNAKRMAQMFQPAIDSAAALQDSLKRLELDLEPGSVEKMKQQLAAASKDAQRIAGPTAFNQAQVVDAMDQLRKAGLSTSDIIGRGGAAEAAASLSTAESDVSLPDAVAGLVSAANIFGVSGDKFGTVADLLVRTGAASSAGPNDLREALSQVSGAGAIGLSIDDTLLALGTLSSTKKGSEAGTDLNNFLIQGAKNNKKYNLGMFDDAGNIKSMAGITEGLRAQFGGMSAQDQITGLNQAYGEQGAVMALALLHQGKGSIEDVAGGIAGATTLDQRMAAMSGTYSGQTGALGGTVSGMLSTLFTPALDPLGAAATKLNEAAGAINDYATDHAGLAKAVSYGSMGAVGLTGLLALAGGAGSGLLTAIKSGSVGSLLKGQGGTAAGVAEGLLLQKAAGVTPVFVTNAKEIGGGLGGPTGAAVDELAAKTSTKALGLLGPAALNLTTALGVALAAVAGWQVGTAINEALVKDTKLETLMNGAIGGATAYSPARFALQAFGRGDLVSDGERAVRAQYDMSTEALGISDGDYRQKYGLDVKVSVDEQGLLRATAKDDNGEVFRSSAARSGPT